ncbi:MAG: hypothetical protein WCT18_04440 [Patescibacteria group bacterium]
MLKNVKLFATIAIFVFTMMTAILPVVAAEADPAADPFGLNAVGTASSLGDGDLRATIGNLIRVALTFLGVVALIIVLIGGFKYMTSGGSDEKTHDARKYIISGIIGLAIVLMAYAITSFVFSSLLEATDSTPALETGD